MIRQPAVTSRASGRGNVAPASRSRPRNRSRNESPSRAQRRSAASSTARWFLRGSCEPTTRTTGRASTPSADRARWSFPGIEGWRLARQLMGLDARPAQPLGRHHRREGLEAVAQHQADGRYAIRMLDNRQESGKVSGHLPVSYNLSLATIGMKSYPTIDSDRRTDAVARPRYAAMRSGSKGSSGTTRSHCHGTRVFGGRLSGA